MITVTLYTRNECHLCDIAKDDLIGLQEEIPHKLVEVDIDINPDLQLAYGLDIPVIEVGPYRLKAPFDRQDLKMTLGAARDRVEDIQQIDSKGYDAQLGRGWEVTGSDKFSYWISRHYMLVFNFFVLLYLGLPFIAPILMSAGLETPASLVYRGYGAMCHQFAFRSWFLFGEQPAYPRSAASVEWLNSYEEMIGLDPADQWAARRYTGEDGIGYKVALCQRDVAIYGGILIFGVIFAVTGRRIKSIPWYVWLLVGILPIALDGFSQIFSQPPMNLIPPLNLLDYRESTPVLRSLTGFLFGFTTAWFGYPLVEETMVDTRRFMASKIARINARGGEKPSGY
jgi:uncharacterized membrane protein